MKSKKSDRSLMLSMYGMMSYSCHLPRGCNYKNAIHNATCTNVLLIQTLIGDTSQLKTFHSDGSTV